MWDVGWAFQIQPMFIHKYFWLKDESTLNILNLNSKENTLQIGIHLLSTNLNDVPIWIWQTNFFFILFLIGSIYWTATSLLHYLFEWNLPRKKKKQQQNGDFHKYSWICIAFSGGLFEQTISFRFKECALVTCLFLIANEVIVRFVNIKYRFKSIPIVLRLRCCDVGEKWVNWNYKLFDSPKGKRFQYSHRLYSHQISKRFMIFLFQLSINTWTVKIVKEFSTLTEIIIYSNFLIQFPIEVGYSLCSYT